MATSGWVQVWGRLSATPKLNAKVMHTEDRLKYGTLPAERVVHEETEPKVEKKRELIEPAPEIVAAIAADTAAVKRRKSTRSKARSNGAR